MAFWNKKNKKKTAQEEAYEKAKAREKEIKKTRKRLKKAGLSAKKAKEKAPKAGKIREGAKGVESTKGGEYAQYGKKTAPAAAFRSAFAAARKAGKSSFTWDGRSYSTAMKGDKKKKVTPPKPKGKGKTLGKEGLKKKAQKASKSRISTPSAKKQIAEVSKQAKKVKPTQPTPSVVDTIDVDTTMEGGEFGKYAPEKMAGGGKVESNPFGWPSSDSRKR